MRSKINRAAHLFTGGVVAFALAFTQFGGAMIARAATTDTWTGAAGDGKFSTATNWSGGTVPVNGDVLAFDASSLTAPAQLTNDLTNLTIGGITVSGNNSNYSGIKISGNSLTIAGNVTDTSNGSGYLQLSADVTLASDVTVTGAVIFAGATTISTYNVNFSDSTATCHIFGQISGSGSVSLAGSGAAYIFGAASPSYTGSIAISSGVLQAMGPASVSGASGITVSGSGSLDLNLPSDSTWNTPITLSGSGSVGAEHSGTGCGGGPVTSTYTATLAGPVTLGSDFVYNGSDNTVVSGTYTSNGHAFTVANGAAGTLTLPNSAPTSAPATATTYSDSQPTQNIEVVGNETATLDGTRGAVQVDKAGTLKGTGTAQTLNVDYGGTVAPGHSPGKLTVLQSLTLYGTYQAQIKDSTAGDYDQLQVSDPSRTTGNDVSIDPAATLSTVLYSGYNIKKGDQFTIINNLQPSSQAVSGTFAGLPEGKQFTVGNVTFSISYVGGDGNDVVLTALSTGSDPGVPNTSLHALKLANPFVLIGVGVATVIALVVAARRSYNRK